MATSHTHKTPAAAALLIDYGGVLTASVVEAFSAACASMGVNSSGFLNEAFAASQAEDSPFPLLELGQISAEEFSERLTRCFAGTPRYRWTATSSTQRCRT